MRLSADRDDPGFKALQAMQRRGLDVDVAIDGVRVRHCVTVDTKRGIAVALDTDSKGRLMLTSRRRDVKRKIVAGRVTLSFFLHAPIP